MEREMHRRRVLKGVAAIGLLRGICSPNSVLAAASPAAQRIRPTDSAWPSEADWDELKQQVGGRLLRPTSMLVACETASASAACLDLVKNLGNPYYIGDQPSGTQVSGWLDAWAPAPSACAVAAQTTADVVAAVNFGRKHNLRLVIKGGGHSYQGTSNAPDSLLIWTRAMHGITLHDSFVGNGCNGVQQPMQAVTVEAGAVWMDVYDAVTTKAGRYVQGGGCATVGVAGLIQSGGFGSFSKRYGLAAASLLEAEIVTADGSRRTVNACTDPELFWALKGGGGGSLGVVTKVVLRTHELPEFFGGIGGTIKATSDTAFRRLIHQFVGFYAETLFNPHWGESIAIKPDNTLSINMVSQGFDRAQQMEIWRPFFDWAAESPREFAFTKKPGAGSMAAQAWWDAQGRRKRGSTSVIFDDRPDASPVHAWWSGDQEQVGAFLYGYESVWLPESLLEIGRRARLSDALFAASRHMDVELHFNKGLAGAPPEAITSARDTVTNPAVLTAFALAIVATGGPPLYPGLPGIALVPAAARRDARQVDAATAALRNVVPNAGSYVSESNYFNRSWQRAFWGKNYQRLRAVKQRYDPDGLFIVHHGVGSEDWNADGFTKIVRRQ
jgi:FAD/FMN-containing dehydrogenase